MAMGNIRYLGMNLSVLFFLVGSGASRCLLDDGKASLSPFPTPVASPKRHDSESSQIDPQNPNKLINQDGSNYPPPPSKSVNNSVEKEEKNDSAKPVNAAVKREEEDKKRSAIQPTPENNSVEKEEKNACNSSSINCQREELVACLKHSKEDSKNLSLLVLNTGKDDFTVKIRGQPSLHLNIDNVALSKNNSKQINLPVNDWNVTEIILNAGTSDCILQIAVPISDWNLFRLFPGYDIRLNPIYGLYLLVFTVVIIGATWACCRFRKRRNKDGFGVPYQQLEMGEQPQPQSTSIVDSNTADSWDAWDEDWDDEAARPSDKRASASISSLGLTSRTPRKDDWDNSWDD